MLPRTWVPFSGGCRPPACASAAGARAAPAQRAAVRTAAAGNGAPRIKVVGVGGCGVDYLASVAAYPRPDDKLRTEKLEVQGGGNCANALTAAARLGLAPSLLTKIGGDGLGDGIVKELQEDGVDTTHALRAAGHPSPFTYIIVDRTGGTRTCIHTPGANLEPSELSPAVVASLLSGAALVYFDGRLTEAALVVAAAARAGGIPVLVEAERLRPNLERLLEYADYVVTSAHFPQDYTGEAALGDALLATSLRLPAARFVITTLGKRGSVMLERPSPSASITANGAPGSPVSLDSLISDLGGALAKEQEGAAPSGAAAPGCVAANGVRVAASGFVSTPGPVEVTFTAGRNAGAAEKQLQAAAARAAALNADAAQAASYALAAGESAAQPRASATLSVTFAASASLPQEAVVDTTGAGDAFIGTVLYGLCTGMPRQRMLQLAAVVAATKCTALGARPGLPQREALSPELLA